MSISVNIENKIQIKTENKRAYRTPSFDQDNFVTPKEAHVIIRRHSQQIKHQTHIKLLDLFSNHTLF